MSKGKTHKRLRIVAIVLSSVLIVSIILGLIFIDNKNVSYEYFEVENDVSVGDEIRVAHLSDLHFPKIEVDISKMVERLVSEKLDIIAITGDLIDRSSTVELCGVSEFLGKIKAIAPIFYVYGNHEVASKENIAKLSNILIANGVIILENESVNINIGNNDIIIIGLNDNADYDKKYLDNNMEAGASYKILLAHRPEKWENYSSQEKGVRPNLILTGHVHGGQFRFFNQGLIAPNQGLFPRYDAGSYVTDDGECTMIISRGIGNSMMPFRFNNNPHVPIIVI